MIETGKELFENIKGRWRSDFFENDHDIVLELACGRGEYTVGLGRLFPERNYIGIDLKGARIWKGSQQAQQEGLQNVAFLRTQIDHLDRFFEKDEVNEIWIVFPDPRPRSSDEQRRLTSPKFIDIYKKILKPGSLIHLKTDSTPLYEYSLEVLKSNYSVKDLIYTDDLYDSAYTGEHYDIKTRYETQFSRLGHKIKYLRFRI